MQSLALHVPWHSLGDVRHRLRWGPQVADDDSAELIALLRRLFVAFQAPQRRLHLVAEELVDPGGAQKELNEVY